MKCPICGTWSTVKLTRQMDGFIQRTRVCGNEHKFTTEERIVASKTHGGARFRKLEPDSVSKVRAGIAREDAGAGNRDRTTAPRPAYGAQRLQRGAKKMNDDIIRMAAEVWTTGSFYPIPSSDDIKHFAELVAAAEREGCAALCDQLSDSSRDLRFGAAIRARGNT